MEDNNNYNTGDDIEFDREIPNDPTDESEEMSEAEINEALGIEDTTEETNDIISADEIEPDDKDKKKKKVQVKKKQAYYTPDNSKVEEMQRQLRERSEEQLREQSEQQLRERSIAEIKDTYPDNNAFNTPEQPRQPEQPEAYTRNIFSDEVANYGSSNFGETVPTVLSNGMVDHYDKTFTEYNVNPDDNNQQIYEINNQNTQYRVNADNIAVNSIYDKADGSYITSAVNNNSDVVIDSNNGTFYSGATALNSSNEVFNSRDNDTRDNDTRDNDIRDNDIRDNKTNNDADHKYRVPDDETKYDHAAEYSSTISHFNQNNSIVSEQLNNNSINHNLNFNLSSRDTAEPINTSYNRGTEYHSDVIDVTPKDKAATENYVASGKLREDKYDVLQENKRSYAKPIGSTDNDNKTPDSEKSVENKTGKVNGQVENEPDKTKTAVSEDKAEPEKRTQEELVARKFTSKGDVGAVFSNATRSGISSLKNAYTGMQEKTKEEVEFDRQKTPYVEAANSVMGALGASATLSSMKEVAYRKADATQALDKVLSNSNISMEQFNGYSKAEIKLAVNNLQEKNVLSKAEAKNLIKYSADASNNVSTKYILKNFAKENKGVFTTAENSIISGNMGDGMKNMTDLQNIYKKYYSKSADPMMRKAATLDSKNLKKFMKDVNAGKIKLKANDIKVLKSQIGITNGKKLNINALNARGKFLSIKKLTSGIGRLVLNIDSPETDMLRKTINCTKIAVKTSKIFGKGFIVVNGALSKVPLTPQWAVKKTVKVVKREIKIANTAIKTNLNKTHAVKSARNKIGRARNKVINTTPAKAIKGAQNKAKEVSNNIKLASDSRKRAKALKKTKRTKWLHESKAAAPLRFLAAPFKTIGAALGKMKAFFATVGKWIFLILGIIIIAYFILMALFSVVGGVGFTTEGTTMTQILVKDPDNMRDLVDRYLKKEADKYSDAMKTAQGAPKHDGDKVDKKGKYPDECYGGETLYHYGHPSSPDDPNAKMYHNIIGASKSDNGYQIVFLDSDGNPVGSDTNNIKDVITLNDIMRDGTFDTNKTDGEADPMYYNLTQQSADKLYDALNPKVTYMVSDLYHSSNSTDKFPHVSGDTTSGEKYYCNDQDFYNKYNDAKNDGVEFYEEPVDQTDKGCEFDQDRYDADVEAYNNGDRDEMPNEDDYYYCPGHDALPVSFGYRDVKIFVTILDKDDVYKAWDNGNVITYKVPTNYECTSFKDETYDINSLYKSTRYNKTFISSGGWGNQSNKDWVDSIESTDWYKTYGVYLYGNSADLGVNTATLTQEEIAQYEASWGNVSASRQDLVNFAMQWVGQIPYDWGSKANIPGEKPDSLDCSGFVQWCIWSTTGVKPASGTQYLIPSMGLQEISKDQLRPGDLGMIRAPGASSRGSANHIGIFVGWDEKTGNAIWCHENGGAHNVSVNETKCFGKFYSLGK